MKKFLALLMCLTLTTFMLAGCSGDENVSQDGGETTADFNLDIPKDYSFKIGIYRDLQVTDYENNALTKWLEEETGYHIEIVPLVSPSENFSVYPVYPAEMFDIIIGVDFGRSGVNDYGEKGHIVDLAPYFSNEQWSGQWWARLNDIGDREFTDYVTRKLYADDGKSIYAFPTIEYSRYDLIRHQVFINQEWMDALELPVPTNADQLYDTLVAFKTRDPNGNRKADEIPLLGCANAKHGDVISWIVNMFCYMEDARPLRVDDTGKISGFFWDDDYRKALVFLHRLVREELLPETVFQMTNEALAQKVNPADGVETVGIWVGNPDEILTDGSNAVNSYKAMPQWGYAVTDMGSFQYGTVVTSNCAYPTGAWKILMALSSEEGYYRMRYGEKGVDWIEAAPGTKSYTGQEAKVQLINEDVFGGNNAKTWNRICSTISTSVYNEQAALGDSTQAWEQAKVKLMGDCYRYHYQRYEAQGGRPDDVLMPLVYTSEEDEEISLWRNNTVWWYKNCRALFIGRPKSDGKWNDSFDGINDPSDDAQWDRYIQWFTFANYPDYLEAAQKIYNKTWAAQ